MSIKKQFRPVFDVVKKNIDAVTNVKTALFGPVQVAVFTLILQRVIFIEISEAGSQCCHRNTDNIEVMTQIMSNYVMIFWGVAEKLLIEMELCFDKYVVRGVLYHTW